VAGGGQRGVLGAVVLEGSAGLVGVPAVGLDDEAVRREVAVDLDAWVVGGIEGGVEHRLRQVVGAGEPEHPRLQLAAGELRFVGDRLGEDSCSSVPVGPGDRFVDRRVVVELQALGLRQRTLQVVGWNRCGDVEQGAVDRRDRDAFTVGGVLGIEGACAVQADPRDAVSGHGGGHLGSGCVVLQEVPVRRGAEVDAGHQDVLDAAVVQVVKDGQPELGALGLLPPDPEDLAVALDGDADRQIAGACPDGTVLADLDHQAIEVGDRVDGVQRPSAPRGDVLQDGVGDAADRVALDLHAVEVAQVRLDIADAHAAGVEAEDPVVQPGQSGLALGHQLGLKAPGAIARGLDVHRAQLGLQGLGRTPIADVAPPSRRPLAGRVAQVLGQLGTQRRLDHPAGQLRQHAARPDDLFRRQAPQRVLELSRRQQPGEPIDDVNDRRPRRRLGTGRVGRGGLRLLRGHGGPLPARAAIRSPPRPPGSATRGPRRQAASVTPTSHRTSDRPCTAALR
jgi:hypothetical protein